MTRARPDKPDRVTFTAYADDMRAIQRVASMLPGLTPHRAALRALRAGLPLVERELREEIQQAARALTTGDDGHDSEGL